MWLQIMTTLPLWMQVSTELGEDLFALQRCYEYTRIKSEDAWIKKDQRPPEGWPQEGLIELQGFSGKQRDNLPLSLRDVSIRFTPGERVCLHCWINHLTIAFRR